MNRRDTPFVVSTRPGNYATGVVTTTVLEVEFNTDMDRESLVGTVLLSDTDGRQAAFSATYDNRRLILRPDGPLAPNTTYILTVVGDADFTDGVARGVLSVLGYPMAGNHVVNFTTAVAALAAPQTTSPPHGATVAAAPFLLQWSGVSGASGYQVALGTAPTLEPALWTGTADNTGVSPAGEFAERQYFWRVRAVGPGGQVGNWSPVSSFVLSSTIHGPVAPGDDSGFAPAPPLIAHPVLLEPDDAFQVGTNLEEIKVLLPYQPQLESLTWRLVGRDLGGNPARDHGRASFTTALLVPGNDGTAVLTLTLEPLDDEDGSTLRTAQAYSLRLVGPYGDHRFSFVSTTPFIYSSFDLLVTDIQRELPFSEGYRYLYLAGFYCHEILESVEVTIPAEPTRAMQQYVRYRAAVDCLSAKLRSIHLRGRETKAEQLGDLRVEHTVSTSSVSPEVILAMLRRELRYWEGKLREGTGIASAVRAGRSFPYPPEEARGF